MAKAGAAAPGPAVTSRPGNVDGKVFVAMFHHLGDKKDSMYCTPEQFTNWLAKMDSLGFRPVTASQYLSGQMNLPKGASPVVMTFDDSNPDQLQLTPDGKVDPKCFVGLWEDYAKTHPEFPVKATFFVLPDVMFGAKKDVPAKLKILTDLGCEIANHTMTHPILKKLSDKAAEQEIGGAALELAKEGSSTDAPLALPYGVAPQNRALLKGFAYEGKTVKPKGVFLVGAEPARSTLDGKFDPTRIPRIQANDLPYGLTFWLKKFADHKVDVYVQP
jgi:peptidoglycan/xylan/chitin deacetylase (PgdA/CDA1 family)